MRVTLIKFLTLVSIFAFALSSQAGTWHRSSNDTIIFRGNIENGEYERFSEVFDSNVKNLVVTSAGGNVGDAIKIAEVLEKHDITIRVRIWCLSSCANYFFTAAKNRIIEKGIVGFHGNSEACFAKDYTTPEGIQKLQERYKAMGLSDQDIKRSIEASVAAFNEMNRREQGLLRRLGVSQSLFVRTCTPDKGMRDGKSYNFFLPNAATFERYGIRNVQGVQDQDTIEWFNGDLAIGDGPAAGTSRPSPATR